MEFMDPFTSRPNLQVPSFFRAVFMCCLQLVYLIQVIAALSVGDQLAQSKPN